MLQVEHMTFEAVRCCRSIAFEPANVSEKMADQFDSQTAYGLLLIFTKNIALLFSNVTNTCQSEEKDNRVLVSYMTNCKERAAFKG